jgi:hydroxymethylpyrimidine pyrophosphatase-like HAD family hydrolase
MVTGRELDQLLGLLNGNGEVFDRIVAENGGLIYEPATKETRVLCDPPPAKFAEELKRRGVERVSVGRVVVATWEPHEDTVLHVIHELGLELQVVFNKGAVMVLPSGVNKASGLCAALDELGLSRHNVVGIGDAENDHALLSTCECGVAVANALQALKDKADLVTKGDHGRGVIEVIDHMLEDDLSVVDLARRRILVGHTTDREITIDPYSTNILVCGTSGSGKSTFTTAVIERLCRAGYQFGIIDPEGDFTTFDTAVVLGGPKREPLLEEVTDVLRDPHDNVVVNLLGVALDHRPEFFTKVLPALAELRVRTGRPHWLVVDEAHHLMPASWAPTEGISFRPHGTLYLTVHPGSVAKQILETIDTVVVLGSDPDETVKEFCDAAGIAKPKLCGHAKLATGMALYWEVGTKHAQVMHFEQPKTERTRHSRKYIEGNLGQSRSFYFRGRHGKLNLKAHNLLLFLQMADGVDDETWQFHLGNTDVARWLRTEVKDPTLADEVEMISKSRMDALESRAAVRAAIEKRYTLPADKPSGIVDTAPVFMQAR